MAMSINNMKCVLVLLCSWLSLGISKPSNGVLLLYRPRDISLTCSQSEELRFDLSFGMGMSDTITLVFRTLNEVNYGCIIDIVAPNNQVNLILVVEYPTSVTRNCLYNPGAFTFLKRDKCPLFTFCSKMEKDKLYETTKFFSATLPYRVSFRFESNSSINTYLNAYTYQVTATAARKIPLGTECTQKNETPCEMNEEKYCFTNGVFCDGIKNCGVSDWFDEKHLSCGLPIEKLSTSAVLAVVAALCLAILAGGHLIVRCLPPLAHSYFIFNANEDNRLCIDPMFKPPVQKPRSFIQAKRNSLVPMFSSSSSSTSTDNTIEEQEDKTVDNNMETSTNSGDPSILADPPEEIELESGTPNRRTKTMRSISERLHRLLRRETQK